MKRLLSYALFFTCVFWLPFASAAKKSSEIPDRREFPVDPKGNACVDFYQYACGPAIDKFELREDRSRHIFSFSDSRERILDAKKEYLQNLLTQKEFNDKSQQLHDYYASCMDQKARKAEELDYLKSKVQTVNALATKKDFAQYLVDQALKGQGSHVAIMNANNLDNSDIFDFMILPQELASLPERSYYSDKNLMKDFEGLAKDFFKIAGMDKPEERAKWVVQFETEYMNNYPTPAEQRDIWTRKTLATKDQLLKLKNLELEKILAKVPAKIKIRNPLEKELVFLNNTFEKYSLEQLKSVYLFQSVTDHMDEAYPDFFKKFFAFNNKYLGGSPKRPPLDERCTQDTMGAFEKEIDSQLFEKMFPNFPEDKFVGLLEKVRASIIEGLKTNKWLSEKSKANAIKKMKVAKLQVVKPKNDHEWDFNPPATYSPQKYINNQEILAGNMREREFDRLGKPVDKSRWFIGPLTVNAYYDPTGNQFVMPAGILQYPFYDPTLPDWVNLGAVGAVVGHELGHGVDDQGAQYDEKGKVRQWMTDKDVKQFQARGAKLVKQFDGAGHNGKLTLGENIGDLVGVTFALNAAKQVMPMDPVARESATKDFFLQYARAWCGVIRPKQVELLLKTDTHALVWARVNEQMKHQPEFAKVYKCKAGDKLVLPDSDQVTIW